MTDIFLHRNDLRIVDNRGLSEASEKGAVPVYAIDPEFWSYYGNNRRAYILANIEHLQREYRNRGSDLIVRHGDTADIVEKVAEEYGADSVYYNRHYVPEHREAERKLKQMHLDEHGFKDRVAVEPTELEEDYQSMSQFYSDWKKVRKEEPLGEPDNLKEFSDRLFDPETFDAEAAADMPPLGHEKALERWEDFRENRLERYKYDRDDVSDPGAVSRMSFFLSNGVIGVREIMSDVVSMIERSGESTFIRNAAKYRFELAWREFMLHVMYYNPETPRENYKTFENEIEWRNDENEIDAWKKGETGVPFVDAGMRQLQDEGYMHNRLRQNVASFLTKHLMCDWRIGEEHFREHLFDHDTANNVGGWQWSASTGTDSVPVRIFNPVKQGRKYDERAEYIKEHLPELRPLSAEEIHDWVSLDEPERNRIRREKDVEYPSPIVDFDSRYHESEKMFKKALGKT